MGDKHYFQIVLILNIIHMYKGSMVFVCSTGQCQKNEIKHGVIGLQHLVTLLLLHTIVQPTPRLYTYTL